MIRTRVGEAEERETFPSKSVSIAARGLGLLLGSARSGGGEMVEQWIDHAMGF